MPHHPARGRGRGRRLNGDRAPTHSEHRQLHDQFRPAASGRARRAAPGAGARRRDHRAGRSAYRPAPPRHREADASTRPISRLCPISTGSIIARRCAWSTATCSRSRNCSASKCRCARNICACFFAELTRISNHMLNLGSHVMDVGAMTPNLWLFELREDCMNFYERASGARMHAAWFRPGGVHQDVPLKLLDRHRRLARHAPAAPVRGRDQPGRRQPHLQAAQRRHRHGLEGRRARLGLLRPDDPRRRHPLGPAQVRSPTTSTTGWTSTSRSAPSGDCYDRFMVRVEEVRQSARIMKQCLNEMPEGPIASARPQGRPAQARRDEAVDGSADPSLQALHRGLPRPRRRSLCRDRKPQGRVRRLSGRRRHATNPTAARSARPRFSHLQAMDFMSKGHMLADVTAILGAIDIVFGECDR